MMELTDRDNPASTGVDELVILKDQRVRFSATAVQVNRTLGR